MTGPPPDEDVLTLAARVLDLARNGEDEQIAAYVDAGVPVDLTDEQGETLLMLAASADSPAAVAALLERGANHTLINDRGQTALGTAVFRRSEASVRALLAAGADPDAGEPSARDLATFSDQPEMLELLDGRR